MAIYYLDFEVFVIYEHLFVTGGHKKNVYVKVEVTLNRNSVKFLVSLQNLYI